jgi:hypothetical protein
VDLLRKDRRLEIVDEVLTSGAHPFRLAFHLGPEIQSSELRATDNAQFVDLIWPGRDGELAAATLELPTSPIWRLERGNDEPVLGWHSPRFGEKYASTTLVGVGVCSGATKLVTALQFLP